MKKYILLLITIIFICILIIIIKNNKTFAAISDQFDYNYRTGIALYENNTLVTIHSENDDGTYDITRKGIFNNLIENDSTILLNKQYPVSYKVLNSGTIDHYIRLTFSFSLLDENENQITIDDSYDNYIKINYNIDPNYWINYYNSCSPSYCMNSFIYKRLVTTSNFSAPFDITISFDESLMSTIKNKETNNNDISMDFKYNKIHPQIDVVVDAMQDHNASTFIREYWGAEVVIVDTEITEATKIN